MASAAPTSAFATLFNTSGDGLPAFSGFLAWLIWVGLHIYRIIGFRNRLTVLLNWAWEYFFYDNQVRLITRE